MKIIAGKTPIEKYLLDNTDVYFKREDLNPSGSFKDRLIEYIWTDLVTNDIKEIVLSSSGNFSISLLYFLKRYSTEKSKKIKIFIKDNLPESKLKRLTNLITEVDNVSLVKTNKPKSSALKYSRDNNTLFLRGSTGKDFQKGYYSLATEIINYENDNNISFSSVIICCSSGTAAQGLMEQLVESSRDLPVFIVQTSHIYSMAKHYQEFNPDIDYQEETKANAISDRIAKRHKFIDPLIKQLDGGGVIVNNNEIESATAELNKLIPEEQQRFEYFTGNAALSLAGYMKLKSRIENEIGFKHKNNYNLTENPLIIISGN